MCAHMQPHTQKCIFLTWVGKEEDTGFEFWLNTLVFL